MGNNNIIGSHVSGSAIGDGTKVNSDNTNAFNTNSFNTSREPMNELQKATMMEVFNKALGQVSNTKQQQALIQAKQELESADGQFPAAKDLKIRSILEKIWAGVKEVNGALSASERAVKYIAPAVAAVVKC